MNILIDTNTYSAFQTKEKTAMQIISIANEISFSVVVLGELHAGFSKGSKKDENQQKLNTFIKTTNAQILPIIQQTTKIYGDIWVALEKKGRKIPTNDMWIAATALEHNLPLFTYDKHFQHIPNLRIIRTIDDMIEKKG